MSADLFAEFASFPGSSQQPQKQTTGSSNSTAQPAVGDPFSFLSSTAQQPAQQPAQSQGQWPSFQTQPGSGSQANTWSSTIGNVAVSSNQPVATSAAEEDDGWGDFEVASPVSQEPPPSQLVVAPTHKPVPSSFDNLYKTGISSQQPPQPPALQRTRVVRASTMDLMTNSLVDMGPAAGSNVQAPPERPSWEQKPVAQFKPKNTDPNVFFDADDFELGGADDDENEEDDDDFGDFETGASSAAPVRAVAAPPPSAEPSSIDLMSSDWSSSFPTKPVTSKQQAPSQLLSTLSLDNTSFGQYPQAPKSPGFQDRNPFPGLAVTTPKAEDFPTQDKPKSPSPVTVWPSLEQKKTESTGQDDWGDDWAAFDDSKPQKDQETSKSKQGLGWEWDALDSGHQQTAPSKPKPKAKPTPKPVSKAAEPPSDWGWDEADQPSSVPEPAAAPTSSSIPDDAPPPTNVPPPSILLSIFPSLFDLLDTAIFKPTSTQPAAVRNKVLASPKTADFLSGYLLLATVASRVIAGRKLRWHRDKFLAQSMSISAAGGKGGMKLAGVDRTQSAREDREAADVVSAWRKHVGRLRSAVATANSSSPTGSLKVPEMAETLPVQTAKMVPTAPKVCIVCGLKREERVKGVDFEVEDSFGEWWVEHWGHRACRNFWLEHEAQLRSK